MAGGAAGAGVMIALTMHYERKIMEKLQKAGAISPETAVTPDEAELDHLERKTLNFVAGRKWSKVKEVDGRYYVVLKPSQKKEEVPPYPPLSPPTAKMYNKLEDIHIQAYGTGIGEKILKRKIQIY